jgi:ABC-type Fe3+-hydroxamate transport system substrate-binding protein
MIQRLFICVLFIYISLNSNSDELEHRIVSLAPSNTAQACDLELGKYMVGITQFCQKPKDAPNAIVIGNLSTPNLELITTLRPTLVLGNVESNRPESMDRLELLGLKVLRLGPSQNMEDIIRDFHSIAKSTQKEKFATKYITQLQTRLKKIQTKLQGTIKKRVFIEIWGKPLMTVSKHGFLHHALELAGGINIFADAPIAYPQISIESVIANKPDVIIILTHSLIDENRVKRYREFSNLQDCVIQQTDASELSQPNPSAFIKAVEFFVSKLHPDILNEINERH